jgi:hypothetical protein
MDQDGNSVKQSLPDHFTIKAGQTLQLLFPVAWPDGIKIDPGQYDLTITIHAVFTNLGESKSTIIIRKPTDKEAAVFKKVNAGKGLHVEKSSNVIDQLVLPDTLKKETGMGFELLLYKLFTSKNPLKKINDAIFADQLPKILVPVFVALFLFQTSISFGMEKQDAAADKLYELNIKHKKALAPAKPAKPGEKDEDDEKQEKPGKEL